MNTLHKVSHALFFVLTSFGVVNAVRAQQASTDSPPAAQSEQPKPPADKVPQLNTAKEGDHSSTPSPQSAASSSTILPATHENNGPSADILKSARNEGFKIKTIKGTVAFCRSEATVGTRFVSESCISEPQLLLWLERAQTQRDGFEHKLGTPEVTK